MSSISSIDGGTSLASFFQNLASASSTSSTAATAATTAASPTTATSSTSGSDASQAIQGGHHHHHHGHADAAKSEFFQQLQTAVTGALQSAQQSGTNPNQAIENAISQIFQNNNSPTSATSQTTATANQGASTSGNGAPAQAGGAANGTPTSSLQAFFNTLQSYGIDPEQFHQDFLTAATNAQNGTASANTATSTAFQSIPTGTLLDAIG